MGNQQSLVNALKEIGLQVTLTSSIDKLSDTDILALPGVGSFPKGMEKLRKLNLINFLKKRVDERCPLIGICLGMQMLFESSKEFEDTEGLSIIKGNVELLNVKKDNQKISVLPHVGWNKIFKNKDQKQNSIGTLNQYFVHSYAPFGVPTENITYYCNYAGNDFVAAVNKNNVSGFQFHPERSGIAGLNILANEIIKLLDLKME